MLTVVKDDRRELLKEAACRCRRVKRQRTKKAEEVASTWAWVSTCPASAAPLLDMFDTGQGRWCIENQGFNALANQWHFDHVFKHKPNAMVVFMLFILLAYIVSEAFYCCNLHPVLRSRLCRLPCIPAPMAPGDAPLSSPAMKNRTNALSLPLETSREGILSLAAPRPTAKSLALRAHAAIPRAYRGIAGRAMPYCFSVWFLIYSQAYE